MIQFFTPLPDTLLYCFDPIKRHRKILKYTLPYKIWRGTRAPFQYLRQTPVSLGNSAEFGNYWWWHHSPKKNNNTKDIKGKVLQLGLNKYKKNAGNALWYIHMILIFTVIISERMNVHLEYDKSQKIILYAKGNLKGKR